jgi:hypothetical protein
LGADVKMEFIVNRETGALSRIVMYTKLNEVVVQFSTGRGIKTSTLPIRRLEDFVTAPRVGAYIRHGEDVHNVAEVLGYDLVESFALVQYKRSGERIRVKSSDILKDWHVMTVVDDDDIGSMTQRWAQTLWVPPLWMKDSRSCQTACVVLGFSFLVELFMKNMATTLGDAASFLNTYSATRRAAFNTLIERTSALSSANAVLVSLIDTGAPSTAITAQNAVVTTARNQYNQQVNNLRTLNDSRVVSQDVVNASVGIVTSFTSASLTTPGGISNSIQIRSVAGGFDGIGVGATGALLVSGGAGLAPSFGVAPGAVGSILTSTGTSSAPSFGVGPGSTGSLLVSGGTGAQPSFGVAPGAVGSMLVSTGPSSAPAFAQNLVPTMPNPSVPSGLSFDCVLGDNSIYTVPSGKMFVLTGMLVVNSSGSSMSVILTNRVGATTHRMYNVSNALPSGTTVVSSQFAMGFQAGDIVGMNTSVAGLYVRLRGVLFDSATSNIRLARRLTSWTNGDNVIYTVPAGRSAISINLLPFMQDATLARGIFHNWSGATVTARVSVVPSGQTLAAKHSILAATSGQSAANGASLTTLASAVSLAAGDSIVVSHGSASQNHSFTMMLIEY